MSEKLLKPALYGVSREDGRTSEDIPVLRGGRCRCGHVFFPMQSYGCELCGAFGEELTAIELRGQGILLSAATVHIYRGESYEAPFTVGSILLRDGPVVRVLLRGERLVLGHRMRAVFVPHGDETGAPLDLRFMTEEGADWA